MGGGLRSRARCVAVASAALVLTVGSARASGACHKGVRPSTTSERTFHVDTLKTIKAAMPPPAAGWEVSEETEVRPPRLMCIGQEEQPLPLEYRIAYRRVGDNPYGSADGPPASEQAAAARIDIDVNPRGVPVSEAVETLNVPGTSLALRGGPDSAPTLYLLFGDWSVETIESSTRLATAHLFDDGPYTKVQALAVRVTGDRAGAATLAGQIRLDSLAALLR